MAQEHSNGDVQIPLPTCPEFKLLMAYVRKRRPMDSRLQQDVPEREPSEETQKAKRKRKKKRLRLSFILKCIKPKTDDGPVPQPAMVEDDVKAFEIENMISELTEISDSRTPIRPCPIESDGEEDNDGDGDGDSDHVVKRLAMMLRVHGDELAEKIEKDKALSETLKSSFEYSFFTKVMDAFCKNVTSELSAEPKDQKVDVALICEATSQLYGINYHPMNHALGFGAKYLHENYSNWISRNLHVGNGEVGDDSKEEVQ